MKRSSNRIILRKFLLLRSKGLFAGAIFGQLDRRGLDAVAFADLFYHSLELAPSVFVAVRDIEKLELSEVERLVERDLIRHKLGDWPTLKNVATHYQITESDLLEIFTKHQLKAYLEDCTKLRGGMEEGFKRVKYQAWPLLEMHGLHAEKPWWWWPKFDQLAREVGLDIASDWSAP